MAIPSSGDLILDVVRAADPKAVETAKAKLASFAGKTDGAGFSEAVGTADAARPVKGMSGAPDAFAKFEAMVLQTFLQSMLPKDTESVYGGGLAGEMWQSMLAEQLGEVMAKRGGIGIADRVLRDHYMEGERMVPLQGVSQDPDMPERQAQRLLSTAMVQEMQRQVTGSLDRDRATALSKTGQ